MNTNIAKYGNPYKQIYELAKAIDNGGTHYKRGKFDIALGGYDKGYELSYNGIGLCAINFDYRLFDDYNSAYNFGLDINKIKKIFEKMYDINLSTINATDEELDGYNIRKKSSSKKTIHNQFVFPEKMF